MLELIGVDGLTQWDVGRQVKVDKDIDMVHFSNRPYGYSKNVKVTNGVADVPDMFLTSCAPLHIWAYIGNFEKGYTKIEKIYEIKPKNRPEDYIYTPEEVKTWEKLQSEIGDLANLKTGAKENLVAAINEVGSIQPDWAQNDETAKDYIKNRIGGYYGEQEIEKSLEKHDGFGVNSITIDPTASMNITIDGVEQTINFTYNSSIGFYEFNNDEFYIATDGNHIYIRTYNNAHTFKFTVKHLVKIPYQYLPDNIKNIKFNDSYNEFTKDEIDNFVGRVEATKKYDGANYISERNQVLATSDGMLFVPGSFIKSKYASIMIDSSLDTQTIDIGNDFNFGTECILTLDVYDTNNVNLYSVPMLLNSYGGRPITNGKEYYHCGQSVAYINSHLYAFTAYRYGYQGTLINTSITVTKIL